MEIKKGFDVVYLTYTNNAGKFTSFRLIALEWLCMIIILRMEEGLYY